MIKILATFFHSNLDSFNKPFFTASSLTFSINSFSLKLFILPSFILSKTYFSLLEISSTLLFSIFILSPAKLIFFFNSNDNSVAAVSFLGCISKLSI